MNPFPKKKYYKKFHLGQLSFLTTVHYRQNIRLKMNITSRYNLIF